MTVLPLAVLVALATAEPAPLVVVNTTGQRVLVEVQAQPFSAAPRVTAGAIEPGAAELFSSALQTGSRFKVFVSARPAPGAETVTVVREVWVNNPGQGKPAPQCQLVVSSKNGDLAVRELTGSAKKPFDLRRADLVVENDTDYALSLGFAWQFDPALPSVNVSDGQGVEPNSERRFPRALHIGRTVAVVTAVRQNGVSVKSVKTSIYVNNPGGDKSPSAQRLVVTNKTFGGLPDISKSGGSTGVLPREGVWKTVCEHTSGGFKGQKFPADLTLKVEGNEIVMTWPDEYKLVGTMSGATYTFEIFHHKQPHGDGHFTFTGNSFTGTWKDLFGKSGNWTGHFKE